MTYEKYRKMQFARGLRSNQTPPEKIMWERLRSRRFLGLKFRRQHPILNYVVDFYCAELKLVLEIDGNIHELQKEYDEIRAKQIELTGVTIIRIQAKEVFKNPENLLNMIKIFKENSKGPSPA